jgi:hypothetical protein
VINEFVKLKNMYRDKFLKQTFWTFLSWYTPYFQSENWQAPFHQLLNFCSNCVLYITNTTRNKNLLQKVVQIKLPKHYFQGIQCVFYSAPVMRLHKFIGDPHIRTAILKCFRITFVTVNSRFRITQCPNVLMPYHTC